MFYKIVKRDNIIASMNSTNRSNAEKFNFSFIDLIFTVHVLFFMSLKNLYNQIIGKVRGEFGEDSFDLIQLNRKK